MWPQQPGHITAKITQPPCSSQILTHAKVLPRIHQPQSMTSVEPSTEVEPFPMHQGRAGEIRRERLLQYVCEDSRRVPAPVTSLALRQSNRNNRNPCFIPNFHSTERNKMRV
jgi:hypothetical protein